MDQSLKDFVSEAEDILESLDDSISQLMDLSEDDHRKPDVINAIFRHAHSLKGLSGMLNLEHLGSLSHHVENLLDAVRLDRIALTGEVIDLLSMGVQYTVRMVRAVAEGKGDGSVDIADFLAEIERVGQNVEKAETGDLSQHIDVPGGLTEMLSEYEEHRFRDNIERAVPFYSISCHLALATFDVELKAIGDQIKTIGELLTTLPRPEGGGEGTIGFLLYFTSREPAETVLAMFEGEDREATAVAYRKDRPDPASPLPAPAPFTDDDRDGLEEEIKGVSNTVRVDIGKLDNLMNLVGELVILKSSFSNIAGRLKEIPDTGSADVLLELEKSNSQMEKKLIELRDGVMDIRMVPMGQLFNRLQRVTKKIARELDKKVNFEFIGGDTELDKMIMEEMVSPLLHMVRNSVDHGIEDAGERKASGKKETGLVRLSAYQQGNHVVLEVEDDGAGIDLEEIRASAVDRGVVSDGEGLSEDEILSLLFRPGFSTKVEVTEISGRGVGMDVVRRELENIGGTVEIQTALGQGTKITMTLPITLAILQALLVRSGGRLFAIPMGSIQETIQLDSDQIKTMQGREVINLRDRTLPLLRLEKLFNLSDAEFTGNGDEQYAVIMGMANRTMGLVTQELLGKQDIVIKPLGESFASTVGLAGAAELGDQSTILVLDVAGLMMEAIRLGAASRRS